MPLSESDLHGLFGPVRAALLELEGLVGRIEEVCVTTFLDRELAELNSILKLDLGEPPTCLEELERTAWPNGLRFPAVTGYPEMPHPEPDADQPDYDVARDSERGK